MIKVALYILAFSLPVMLQAQVQWGKTQIATRFKNITYNPDSSISSVKYHALRFKYRCYGIDYDTLGRPLMIGKYKHGLKEGGWLRADGTVNEYSKGELYSGLMPGCGTGLALARKRFKALYDELIH